MQKNKGFTLLELLIAIFLSTLIAVTIALSLRFTLGIWWRGISKQEKYIDFFKITHLLGKQLRYITSIKEKGLTITFFMGDENSLSFITNYALLSVNKAAPVLVKYEFRDDKFFYSEVPFTGKIDTSLEILAETKPKESEISFSCHCAFYEKDEIYEAWSKEKKRLPDKVKLEVKLKGETYKFVFRL